MLRPKKRLGQHFLTDHHIAERITSSLKAGDYTKLIEIGPGKGILTSFLLSRKDIELFPVEIDKEAVEYLLGKWPVLENRINETDFLSLNLKKEFGEKFGIIGNFPYNISSQIFFRILEYKDCCREVVCMIQKEVADRILSSPGKRIYGILSVLLQTWYRIDYLFKVNPGSFFPPPKVNSSVIRLIRNDRTEIPTDENFFYDIVKTAFNQRRKMLRNSLGSFLPESKVDFPFSEKRPEQLSVEDFIKLAIFFKSKIN